MLETNSVELPVFRVKAARPGARALLRRHFQNLLRNCRAMFRLAIRVDDIAQFLQRAKNEKMNR